MVLINKNFNQNQKISEENDVLYDSINLLADFTRINADKLLINGNIDEGKGKYLFKRCSLFLKRLNI